MMRYMGGLRDAADFMQAYRAAMNETARMHRQLSGLGDVTYDAMGNVASFDNSPTNNVIDPYLASSVVQANGTTVNTFTDGTVQLLDASGNDVTTNFIPQGQGPLQHAVAAVGSTISNATSSVTDAVSNVAIGTFSTIGTLALIAAIGFALMEASHFKGASHAND
jgi:hypothetical protein